ncbi:hypothetical protein, partial [Pseudomonas sp. CFBP 13719]|uniref:hypothetical protein n=1 Tax=Pseudomonas sp. CFBP 13719 TaxID=2775303 RepID=UPI001A92F149
MIVIISEINAPLPLVGAGLCPRRAHRDLPDSPQRLFAATDRSYDGLAYFSPVGAVIGREGRTAVYLMHRSAFSRPRTAPTMAWRISSPVGAVTGREGRTAVCLMHRGAFFA